MQISAPKRLLEQAKLVAHRLDIKACPFVVVSMFTASHRGHADRLRKSLFKHELNYAIYEVPSIHSSISANGSDDLRFCKPSFILAALDAFQRPVLYVDADVVFESFPQRIADAVTEGADLAVFNWLASDRAFRYSRTEVAKDLQLYFLDGWTDRTCKDQLIVSGMTQFYNDTPLARDLLRAWLTGIERWPEVDDDELLDNAFNNVVAEKPKALWLEPEYCRCPFFIFSKPVIDHPEWPSTRVSERSFQGVNGVERYDPSKGTPKAAPPVGLGLFIDAVNRRVYDQKGLFVGALPGETFIQNGRRKG